MRLVTLKMERFECPKCKKVFHSFVEREKHYLDEHYLPDFVCKNCGRPVYGFSSKNHKCQRVTQIINKPSFNHTKKCATSTKCYHWPIKPSIRFKKSCLFSLCLVSESQKIPNAHSLESNHIYVHLDSIKLCNCCISIIVGQRVDQSKCRPYLFSRRKKERITTVSP